MRKYMYLYYMKGQIMAVATHRIDGFGCDCHEYRNITPSTHHRLKVLANQPYTVVDSWDVGDCHTVEVNAGTWKLPTNKDLKLGTRPEPMSIQSYSVIRTLWVNVDRQGNRSAIFTKVVEGVGCIVDSYHPNITFRSFIRFMTLTLDYDYAILPFDTTVSFMVQKESIE